MRTIRGPEDFTDDLMGDPPGNRAADRGSPSGTTRGPSWRGLRRRVHLGPDQGREARFYAQRVVTDRRRFAYLDRLTAAAGGDESMTWEAAHALLPDDEPEALP